MKFAKVGAVYTVHACMYAERWGHTLGFKAAGSLTVHTTVAAWNAWEIKVTTPQCIRLHTLVP